jgi:hypothetical protein
MPPLACPSREPSDDGLSADNGPKALKRGRFDLRPPRSFVPRVFAMVAVARQIRVSAVLALLAVFVVLLASVGPARASGPDGRVRGFVTDSASGAPIVGAAVRAEASDFPWVFQATSDASGFFQFSITPHRYTLTISNPAHLRNATGIAVGSGQTVWANMSLRPASSRTARIQGYVTDSVSSAPVTVGAIVARPWAGSFSNYENRSALNASGYYSINLIPDSYDISTDAVFGYSPYDYYPVNVYAGVLWYNLTLNPDPVNAWINGTVRDDATSAPTAGATITAKVDGLLVLPSVTSNATGIYSLHAPSGSVEIAADAAGHAPASTTVYVYGAGNYYQDLRLLPLSNSIRGYLKDGVTKAPLAGVPVSVAPIFFNGYYDQTTTNASGYYEVPVPADYYSVSASKIGYTSWNTWVLLFSVSGTAWANGTLWPIISRVSGYLIDAADGSHIPGLLVQAIDLRTSYQQYGNADSSGFFSFQVPPTPAMSIWVYGSGVYAGNVAYVATTPYATTWVNITIARLSAQIHANVTNALTGAPISGVTLIAAWFYGNAVQSTDVNGTATLRAPAGIDVYVNAIATGYQYWTGLLTPVAGSNNLSIQLWPNLPTDVRIRGWVRDASSGAGMWPATVEATGYDGTTATAYTNLTGYFDLSTVAAPQSVRAIESGYAGSQVAVNPASGDNLWVNLTLTSDSNPPVVRSFTATPASGLDPTHPTTLAADVSEMSLNIALMSILMEYSSTAGVGTFLRLGGLPAAGVSVTSPSFGNYSVTSSWDTRMAVGHLTDALSNAWWPVAPISPFLAAVGGYYDDATLSTPAYGNAVFDTRDGRLLFVITGSGFVGPHDDISSTFAPRTTGYRIDLSTAAILGYSLVSGPTFSLGSLRMGYSSTVPSGLYAGLVELQDTSGGYASAAVLMQTAADTIPPIANAGPDLTVDEDTVVTFDGFGSTDNVGITVYTWTFMDGTLQTLSGAGPSYVFHTPGRYLVTLAVRDADGNVGVATITVTVRDVKAPSVSIVSPSESAHLAGTIIVDANATDNVGVVMVELLVDGVYVGNDTAAPFEFVLPAGTLSLGNHTFEIIAFDAAGNHASQVRHVTVVASSAGGPLAPAVLIYGGIGFLLLLVVVVVALIMRSRRRRPPTMAPPVPPSPPPAPPPAVVETPPVETPAPPESPPPEPDPDFDLPIE